MLILIIIIVLVWQQLAVVRLCLIKRVSFCLSLPAEDIRLCLARWVAYIAPAWGHLVIRVLLLVNIARIVFEILLFGLKRFLND